MTAHVAGSRRLRVLSMGPAEAARDHDLKGIERRLAPPLRGGAETSPRCPGDPLELLVKRNAVREKIFLIGSSVFVAALFGVCYSLLAT